MDNDFNYPLDEEEQYIEDIIDQAKSVKNKNDIINKAVLAAEGHHKKTETITLRISPFDLEAMKMQANRAGIPYQTFINALMHKCAAGEIKVDLN